MSIVTKKQNRTVNKTYRLNDSYYKGEIVELLWISSNANIVDKDGLLQTQCQCRVLSKGIRVNVVLEFLDELHHVGDDEFLDFKNLSNVEIVKLTKNGDFKAKKEFIRRFKRLPKL